MTNLKDENKKQNKTNLKEEEKTKEFLDNQR
jgi:hypothetical protein